MGRKWVGARKGYTLEKAMGQKELHAKRAAGQKGLQARKGHRPERATGQKGQWV